jgi:nucleoside-diphosphate-sugar epimerase
MAQKKFLVTGATGDTGGYTVEQLLERGHAVRALAHREDDRSKRLEKIGAEVLIGVRTRNGNLSTVRSSLLVDWSANVLRRNAQPPSQSSWSSNPFCRKTSCNRVLERFLLVE